MQNHCQFVRNCAVIPVKVPVPELLSRKPGSQDSRRRADVCGTCPYRLPTWLCTAITRVGLCLVYGGVSAGCGFYSNFVESRAFMAPRACRTAPLESFGYIVTRQGKLKRSNATSPRPSSTLFATPYTTHQHIMILTLSSESVRNTVFTDEHALPVFKSNTPFRLGFRTTTISRQMSDKPTMEDPIEVMGRIGWRCFGSSIFTIGGTRLESNAFLPRHGFFGR